MSNGKYLSILDEIKKKGGSLDSGEPNDKVLDNASDDVDVIVVDLVDVVGLKTAFKIKVNRIKGKSSSSPPTGSLLEVER